MTISNNNRFEVRIDAEIEPVMPVFFKCRKEDIVAIETALAVGDYIKIASVGHKIKGAGGSFGFDAIYEMGKEIEHAAGSADMALIRETISRLNQYLELVDIIYT